MSSIPTTGQIVTQKATYFEEVSHLVISTKEERGRMSHVQTSSQDISYFYSKPVLFVV